MPRLTSYTLLEAPDARPVLFLASTFQLHLGIGELDAGNRAYCYLLPICPAEEMIELLLKVRPLCMSVYFFTLLFDRRGFSCMCTYAVTQIGRETLHTNVRKRMSKSVSDLISLCILCARDFQ